MTTFIQATKEDIPLLHRLGDRIFRQTYRTMLSQEQIEYMIDWMYSEENLEKQMDNNNVFYIVKYDGEACGYIGIENEADGHFHLQRLYLDEAYRGKGIGRDMMEKIFDHARKASPSGARLELNVNRDNKTVEFYKKMGWRIIKSGDFDIGNGFLMTDHIMAIYV